MILPQKRKSALRAIAVIAVISLAFTSTACSLETVNAESDLGSVTDVVSVPPQLETPDVETIEPENTDYEDAINSSFNNNELLQITPKADMQLPDIEIETKFTNTTDLEIPKGVEELIINFHKDRYASLGALRFLSTSQYFDTTNIRGKLYAAFNDTVIEYLIYVRKNRTADLSYEKASFGITVNEAEVTRKGYKLTYMINDAIDFAFTDITSYSAYMEAEIFVELGSDGVYRFVQYAEDTDVNLLFEEQVMDYLGYNYDEHYLKNMPIPRTTQINEMMLSLIENQKKIAMQDIDLQSRLLLQKNANPDIFKFTSKAKYKYDAAKAVAYSYMWVDEDEIIRNPDYVDYSVFGGNCQNYVSQCLLAGGIPMDIVGSYERQWKWYSDDINYEQSAWGRVPSWAGTEFFYNYCNENTGKGLKATVSASIYAAEIGDVMQYVVDDWARHSVIVSEIVYDDEGNIVEILVNSNTTDHVNYPLTAYGYTNIRLIHIDGYN